MTFGQILGLIAIIIGFIAGVSDKGELFGLAPLVWFVLAIALVLVLGVGAIAVPFATRKQE